MTSLSPADKLAAICQELMQSSGPKNNVPPDSIKTWCLNRTRTLCGAELFEAAAGEPAFDRLLAFGYMVLANYPSWPLSKIDRYTRLPKTLEKLEPDFFEVLAREIVSESNISPDFARRLKEAQEELKHLAIRLQAGRIQALSQPGSLPRLQSHEGVSVPILVANLLIQAIVLLTVPILAKLKS